MREQLKKNTHTLILLSLFLFSSCSKEKKDISSLRIDPANNQVKLIEPSKENTFDPSMLNSVCNCYKYGLSTLEDVITIRKSFPSLEEYNESKEKIFEVKILTKRWRFIQQHCLKTYQIAMVNENDCGYHVDTLGIKKIELSALGIEAQVY